MANLATVFYIVGLVEVLSMLMRNENIFPQPKVFFITGARFNFENQSIESVYPACVCVCFVQLKVDCVHRCKHRT